MCCFRANSPQVVQVVVIQMESAEARYCRYPKVQGQTLRFVGFDLIDDIFMHEDMYVALSRVWRSADLLLLMPDDRVFGEDSMA